MNSMPDVVKVLKKHTKNYEVKRVSTASKKRTF